MSAASDNVSPERQWKTIFHGKLWMIEDLNQDYPSDIVFKRLPKFSLSPVLLTLFLVALLLIGLSYCIDESCKWFSGLCLNLAMGVVASLLIFFYTNKRDRIIAGYGAVVDLLQSRIEILTSIYKEEMKDPQFVFQTDTYSNGCGWLYAHLNFGKTIGNFFNYVEKYLSPVFDDFDWARTQVEMKRIDDEMDDPIGKFIDKWRHTNTEDLERAREMCGLSWQGFHNRMNVLQQLLMALQCSVASVKVGNKRCQSISPNDYDEIN